MRKVLVINGGEILKILFTRKSPEQLLEGIKPDVVEKIRKGQVEKGMTKNEVMLSYGYPQAHRTPSPAEDTWIYFNSPRETKRIIFNRKGLLIDIIKQEEVKK